MVDGQPFPKHHVLSVMYSGHDTGKFVGTCHCTYWAVSNFIRVNWLFSVASKSDNFVKHLACSMYGRQYINCYGYDEVFFPLYVLFFFLIKKP